MARYGVYFSDCKELWEETFESIEEAAEAIKRWIMDDELIEFERFQIVELKPAAEFDIKIELMTLPKTTYLMFQGEPFKEEDFDWETEIQIFKKTFRKGLHLASLFVIITMSKGSAACKSLTKPRQRE